jgi:branched-chain amino acid transport system ATP-binding protein
VTKPSASGEHLLQIQQLTAGYGASQVLFGIDLNVRKGELVTLLGRNGMGKSTLVKCLTGLLKPTAGQISFNGQSIAGIAAHRIGQAGMGLVPEGRQVFPTLTVEENLVATRSTKNAGTSVWTLDRVYALFPRLKERTKQLASKMSGGEQQMLAVGRALMTNPRLLILDEATEGLAPIIRDEIWNCLKTLKAEGQSMIVIDKHLKSLLPLADHHAIIDKGNIAWRGTSTELAAAPDVIARYLGV